MEWDQRKCYLSNPTLLFVPWYIAIYISVSSPLSLSRSLSPPFSLGLLNSLVSPSHTSFFIAASWLVSFLSIPILFFLASSVCLYQGCWVQFCSLDCARKDFSFPLRIYHSFTALRRGMCLLIMWWNWMWQGYRYCSITGQKQCHLIRFITQHKNTCDLMLLVWDIWDRKDNVIEGPVLVPVRSFVTVRSSNQGFELTLVCMLLLFRSTWFLTESASLPFVNISKFMFRYLHFN